MLAIDVKRRRRQDNGDQLAYYYRCDNIIYVGMQIINILSTDYTFNSSIIIFMEETLMCNNDCGVYILVDGIRVH